MTAQERAERSERLQRDEEAEGADLDDLSELQDAIGEDIDEAIEDVSNDHAEPSEAQKREILKNSEESGPPGSARIGSCA